MSHTEEQRVANSERNRGNQYARGTIHTAAQNDAQRRFMTGNTYGLGYKHSAEENAAKSLRQRTAAQMRKVS